MIQWLWQGEGVWCLDPVNSGELIAELRPHARDYEFEVAWVGEGWRPLVRECHRRLSATFPEYELQAIEQSGGVLAFRAVPLQPVIGEVRWSPQEADELDAIVEEFRARSATVCEWCGAGARLRGWRTIELTLCDGCDARFPDPPRPALSGITCR
ncbi:hypothetical protein [Longispora albida]|uniref:hypothetical protein n=1 Tax=Longispora albida TaxID=203523 RepID=UPI00037FB6DA|nr:hypothetical protein [Longispora albida]